jgi:hypothetical protein
MDSNLFVHLALRGARPLGGGLFDNRVAGGLRPR